MKNPGHWQRRARACAGWKLAQSPGVEVFARPAIPGIARVGDLPARPTDSSLAIAEAIGADLTVVGPEAPLVAGVVDAFRARGLRDRRARPRGGATGRQQDFRKELFMQSGYPDRRLRHRRERRRGAQGARPLRLPGGPQGRRPGGGQRRDHRARPRRGRGRARHAATAGW